ncbi:alpha/beta hydrolase [Ahniella affigens]|uniref:Alpha/beta hydrolase n=1 Tax=Ahniella affigens TaxID=2021234 RepID=A0A2P1PUC7_9GAMM|nr:alpha/beta hydrolase [Ahniella affigens]AVP98422.1 alpha/beta hydrolase [Ahniella affigens]
MVALSAIAERSNLPSAWSLKTADGADLHADHWPGGKRPLLFTHGLGQSRMSWTTAASAMAEAGHTALALDWRGHGRSHWNPSETPYSIEQLIHDAEAFAAAQAEPPIWIGASMGGLAGIAVAARHPGLLKALVLVDVTPRWEVAGVQRILGFMRAFPDGFATLEAAQDAVQQYLPHRAQKSEPERLAKMLVPMRNGRLRWHWDPRLLDDLGASGEREMHLLLEAARTLSLPVLLISGSKSDVVSDHTITEFLELVPHAEHRVVRDATHMVVGDDNQTFTEHLTDFLDRHA